MDKEACSKTPLSDMEFKSARRISEVGLISLRKIKPKQIMRLPAFFIAYRTPQAAGKLPETLNIYSYNELNIYRYDERVLAFSNSRGVRVTHTSRW